MTPSAQLADYVFPADSWLERPWLTDNFSWMSTVRPSQKSMEPPGQCKTTFEFWKAIADAIGRPELVPWRTLEELYDYRLTGMGIDFETFAEEHEVHFAPAQFKKYEKRGFATPSGKVELKSSVLENLGFDPLPYFREDPPIDPKYPLKLFTGVREDEFFQTGHRHIPELRRRKPEPSIFVSPGTAVEYAISEGDMVVVDNELGQVSMLVAIHDTMPDGLVRVPHGWWKPEMSQGIKAGLSGAMEMADSQLCRDDDDYLDREQGIPHLKGVPCRILKTESVTEEVHQV